MAWCHLNSVFLRFDVFFLLEACPAAINDQVFLRQGLLAWLSWAITLKYHSMLCNCLHCCTFVRQRFKSHHDPLLCVFTHHSIPTTVISWQYLVSNRHVHYAEEKNKVSRQCWGERKNYAQSREIFMCTIHGVSFYVFCSSISRVPPVIYSE